MQADRTDNGIYIYLDQAEYSQIQEKLGDLKRRTPTVIARAANRSVNKARMIVRKETSAYYETTQKDVERGFSLQRATVAKPYAVLHYDSPYINLYKWKGSRATVLPKKPHQGDPRTKRKGEPIPKFYKAHAERVNAGGKKLNREPNFKPFVQTGSKTKANALFVRRGKKRYPIIGLAGPAMSQGIKQPMVMDRIESQVMSEFEKRVEHEIDAALKGYAK